MRTQTFWIALVGAVVMAGSWGTGAVHGQDTRESEERVHKLREQVKELVEAGRQDAADRLEQQIAQIQEESRQRPDKERGDRPDHGDARQRLAELTRHLAELKEQGKPDAAERVARQIAEIRQRLERTAGEEGGRPKPAPDGELEERLAGMKRRIAELKEAGRSDEADRLAQEAREMLRRAQGSPGDASDPGQGLEHRIGHLRQAAEHLQAAGLDDVAANLMRQSERMAQEAAAARHRQEAQRGEGDQLSRQVEELSRAVRDIRQQMERMERQIRELSERVERR
jgi:hypothetical protein